MLAFSFRFLLNIKTQKNLVSLALFLEVFLPLFKRPLKVRRVLAWTIDANFLYFLYMKAFYSLATCHVVCTLRLLCLVMIISPSRREGNDNKKKLLANLHVCGVRLLAN